MTMGTAEWLSLAVMSLLWGSAFVFVKVALAEVPPLTLVWARLTLAAGMLWSLVAASGGRPPRGARGWAPFLVLAALNNAIPFTLLSWAQTRIPSGVAAILNASTPLFTAVLAHFLTRDERLTAQRLAGVLIGMGGVAVMVGPEAVGQLGGHGAAEAAALAAALCYALGGIYGRRLAGWPPTVTAAAQTAAGSAMLLPLVVAVDRPWTRAVPGAGALAAVAALGLLSTALAYVLFFRLLARTGATHAALVTLLIPVVTMLLAAAFLGERPTPGQLLGMAGIGAGLAAVDGRPLRWLARWVPRWRPAARPVPPA